MINQSSERHSHGPWVDVHAHPGRCFLGGLDPTSPMALMLGAENAAAAVQSSLLGEVAVVNSATVADMVLIGLGADGGLHAMRSFEPGEAVADHRRQINAMDALIDGHTVAAVLSSGDIVEVASGDIPGVFVSCEGADFLDGQLGGLDDAYSDGVRSITLVHYHVNELGDIQTEDSVHGGLTTFGREVVTEMNRLGMIVDLAHATFEATVAALDASTAPIMISHSHLASAGSDHPRLLSVEHATAVADGGGLIGAWPSGVIQTTLDDYCAEICRLVDVVGIDHVSIGTDMDANYKPVLTTYEQFPDVAASLLNRGMTSDEVDQVLGGNFIQLFKAVEAVAG
ncbi:MAG: hypothetical protein GXP35_07855 [Actinobacteria bacterium]|nr:hypothetical protein [Actinomycetota bacterium]